MSNAREQREGKYQRHLKYCAPLLTGGAEPRAAAGVLALRTANGASVSVSLRLLGPANAQVGLRSVP